MKDRDKALIEYLYINCHRTADGIIESVLGNQISRHDREDLIQDVFVKMLSHTEDIEGDTPGEQRAYVYKAMKRRAIDEGRRLSRIRNVSLEEIMDTEALAALDIYEITPESIYLEKEKWEETSARLHRALERLPHKDYKLLVSKYFGELSDRQMEKKLGIKESMVRVYVSRARKKALEFYLEELELEKRR